MKRLKMLSALAVVLLTASCGLIGGTSMSDGQVVEKVKELVAENIDTAQYKVVEVTWDEDGLRGMESDKLSNSLHRVRVLLLDKDGRLHEKIFADVDLKPEETKPLDERLVPVNFDPANVMPIDLASVDTAAYSKCIVEAIKMIPAEYEFESVGKYIISGIRDRKLEKTFTLNVTEKGNSTEFKGKRVITNYYMVDFKVEDGKPVMVED